MDRIPYGHPFRFMVLGRNEQPPDQEWTEGEILDLGDGGIGMRIEGAAPLEGTVLQARLPIADTAVSLPVLAQVKWIKKESPDRCLAGLRFLI
jgi:hypothetical protein